MNENDLQGMLLNEYYRMAQGPGGTADSSALPDLFQVLSTTATALVAATQTLSTAAPNMGQPSGGGILAELGPLAPPPSAAAPQPTAAEIQAAAQGGGSSVAASIGQTALHVFTSGLGIVPLVSGLIGLFGGGGSDTPPPLAPYTMPPAIRAQAADANGGIQSVDYGQDGKPRTWGEAAPAAAAPASAAPQITVNVQAMDSRSFLDHSDEIAQAVRDAMLNMHAINDVVTDL